MSSTPSAAPAARAHQPVLASLRGAHLRQLILAIVIIDVLLVPASLVSYLLLGKYMSSYGGDATGLLLSLGTVVQLGVAALVALRLPRHPVGWLLLASVTSSLVDSGAMAPFVIYAVDVRHHAIPGGDLLGTVEQMMWIVYVVPMAIHLPLVFPSGKLLSGRWRPVIWLATIAAIVGFIGGSFAPRQDPHNMLVGVQPVRLPGPLSSIADVMQLGIIILPLFVLAGVVAMILRYRRGSSEERHQLKWLIAAVTVYLVGFGASIIPTMAGTQVSWLQSIAVIGLALIPVAAAVAVLKYRLYDIDIVISRALVYGALAVFITAVYVAIVVGVGTLAGVQGRPNLVLSIVATAIVAGAFQPVRERLQRVANRMVYGKRATPYEVLSQFSEHVAESYAAGDVLPRMAKVLAEGTGADRAEVWLRTGDHLRAAAAWPAAPSAEARPSQAVTGQLMPAIPGVDRAIPVRQQGTLLGALTVTKLVGESLTPVEEKLLDDLGAQAGLVLENVGLTADLEARLEDLRASRQRLVAAQDHERRRLERDLHDGAQQNLVAIKVKLGLAEMMARKDPARAKSLVTQLKADTDEALETLRDLARGIYPPLLADKGLAAALEAQARKATVPVEVAASGVGRYAQETEAAVYFCVLEALQNTQKYARANQVTVGLREEGGQLRFGVRDDGEGFDQAVVTRGSGTQNMEDRLNALGGTLVIRSTPGTGTEVDGSLPISGQQPAADSPPSQA